MTHERTNRSAHRDKVWKEVFRFEPLCTYVFLHFLTKNFSNQPSNFLRATGILDAYEDCISSMIVDAWPADESIFDHAAYLILKY